jgi:hypothetical protein
MRTSMWAVLLLGACSSPRIVDDDGSTAETGDDEGDDDGTDDGVEPDGLYVDCAMLGPNEPTVGPGDPGALGFPIYACNPRSSGESEGGHRCCSTDPATADGALPAYENLGIVGSPPLYADAANDAGTWGMCVRTDDVGSGLGLLSDEAAGCPMPCNPTWSFGDISSVCGPSRSCCQALELGPKDCVRDETGTWRAVTGADIGNQAVTPSTVWNSVAHDTHQDPNGTVCQAFAGDPSTPEFIECIRHLGVADQRGYCMALGPGQACPSSVASYVDVCEAMN